MKPMSPFDLEGRSIVVTGGGGHLGSAVVLGLARLGAHVVACGRSDGPLLAVREASRAGGETLGSVTPLVADVRDMQDVARVIGAATSHSGLLSGWVNNAVAVESTLWPGLSETAVAETLSAGLTRIMLVTDLVAQHMSTQGFGSIVNVASMYGMVAPQPAVYEDFPHYHSPPAYGAAKAGLLQFTRYMAVHLAKNGVRVNAVSPGAFPSPDVQRETAFVDALDRSIPMGRVGRSDEMVGPIAFLLSDSSSYVTGHNLVVDGGWTSW